MYIEKKLCSFLLMHAVFYCSYKHSNFTTRECTCTGMLWREFDHVEHFVDLAYWLIGLALAILPSVDNFPRGQTCPCVHEMCITALLLLPQLYGEYWSKQEGQNKRRLRLIRRGNETAEFKACFHGWVDWSRHRGGFLG